ncbi:MAG: permease prefix domain 2-containing transporter, partial [Bacteroidota bacterium]
MDHQPPKWARRLLLFFLRDEFAEEVLGDLDEKFYVHLDRHSPGRARRNYWVQVLSYFRPFAIRDFFFLSIFPVMIQHNFRIGLRVILKNKLFSTINIGGLALGMTVAVLIGLWIHDELTFNQNHEKYDRIVQVLRKDSHEGIINVNSSLVGMLGEQLRQDYGHLYKRVAMTFYRPYDQLIQVGDQAFEEMGFYFEPDIGEMLTLDMVSGSRDGLNDPKSILISESLARKSFGDINPVGELVKFNVSNPLKVAGVYRDLPNNSTFHGASFFVSMHRIYNESNPYVWDNYNMRVYAELKPGIRLEEAALAIKDLMLPFLGEDEGPKELLLLPMKDWHLRDYFENGLPAISKRMEFIYLYGILGILVLLIACINFMNLNTARYQTRGKEVGVRKTIGSIRSQLVGLFLTEAVLYTAAALILSLVAVSLAMPWFNEIAAKELSMPWTNGWFWLACLGFVLM